MKRITLNMYVFFQTLYIGLCVMYPENWPWPWVFYPTLIFGGFFFAWQWSQNKARINKAKDE